MLSDQWVTVITAFGGTIVGAIASFVPAFLLERSKRKQDIAALRSAVVTEIAATLDIMKRRKYVENVDQILCALEDRPTERFTLRLAIPDQYFPVYRSQLGSIGLLPDEIRDDAVIFYQLLEAAICDVRPGGLVAEEGGDLAVFQELHGIIKTAINIGEKIVAKNHTR